MSELRTQIHRYKVRSRQRARFCTGVSLHSHTMHSKEYLGRRPTYFAKFPAGSYILEREIGRLRLYEGRIFNFHKVYWTPPLSTREAYELEGKQIVSDAPGEFGRRHWMTRVCLEQDGASQPLSQFTGTRFQRLIDKFRWVIGLVANPLVRPALRLPFFGYEEGGL